LIFGVARFGGMWRGNRELDAATPSDVAANGGRQSDQCDRRWFDPKNDPTDNCNHLKNTARLMKFAIAFGHTPPLRILP
jgi:hypothetical protein